MKERENGFPLRYKPDGIRFDYDLNLFMDVVAPLDKFIDRCYETDGEVADMLDYHLLIEHIIGLGLAAAQVYLTVTEQKYDVPSKERALSLEPRHQSGIALVKLINHGANYWKHSDEWNDLVSNNRKDIILNTFKSIGIHDSNPLYCLLKEITGNEEPLLHQITPILEEWRIVLEKTYSNQDEK